MQSSVRLEIAAGSEVLDTIILGLGHTDRFHGYRCDLRNTLHAIVGETTSAISQTSELIMGKDFMKMTAHERDLEAKKLDREISLDETSAMSPMSKALWESAKRGRGRPRKPSDQKAERILISIEPGLLAMAEDFAASNGLDAPGFSLSA